MNKEHTIILEGIVNVIPHLIMRANRLGLQGKKDS